MSATTNHDHMVKLTAEEARLVAQALAYRYGTQYDVDAPVNGWLLDLLPRFTGPTAQRDGLHVSVLGDHARTIRRSLAIYVMAETTPPIPAGWLRAADDLWGRLIDAYRPFRDQD